MEKAPENTAEDQQFPRKQVSQTAFETSLNMDEVQTVESVITPVNIASAEYQCTPTTLQLKAGNVEWTWESNYNTSGGVDLYLRFISKTTSTIWKIALHLNILFKTPDNTIQKEIRVSDQVFDHIHKEWKMEISKDDWNTLAASFENVDREENTSKTEPMTIEVQISVGIAVGFRLFFAQRKQSVLDLNLNVKPSWLRVQQFRNRIEIGLDFSVVRGDSDLLFIFGEKKVFLNVGVSQLFTLVTENANVRFGNQRGQSFPILQKSTYLAVLSPYFAATQERLEKMSIDPITNIHFEKMVDVDHDQFVELMQIVYPSRKKVTEYVLLLADRFLFNNVLVDAERFLIDNVLENHDIFTKLQWSYTYSMADLQLTSFESINAVMQSPVYSKLSVEILRSLLEKMTVTVIAEKALATTVKTTSHNHTCGHCNRACNSHICPNSNGAHYCVRKP